MKGVGTGLWSVLHAVSKHICCYGILVNTMLKSKVDEGF